MTIAKMPRELGAGWFRLYPADAQLERELTRRDENGAPRRRRQILQLLGATPEPDPVCARACAVHCP